MAITAFVGSTVQASNANVTPVLPTTPQAGDLIVIPIGWRNGGSGVTNVAGYTLQYHVSAAARSLILWYKIAVGGEGNPTVEVSGGTGGNTIAACAVVLRPSEGSTWAWGTEGATYTASGALLQDIGPIAAPTGAGSQGVVFFAGFKNSGDATNVAVLSGNSLAWTRYANHFTTVSAPMSFVGSLGIWSGGLPTLTSKTFDFTSGTDATVLGKSAVVNEVLRLQGGTGYGSLAGQKANLSLTGRSLEALAAYGALVGQKADLRYNPTIDAAVGYGALVGQQAGLTATRSFVADASYGALVGQSANLTVEEGDSLDALPGYGVLVGQKASLALVYSFQVQHGVISLVGQPASFSAPLSLQAKHGIISLVGQSADLFLNVPTIELSRRPDGTDLEWLFENENGIFGDLNRDATGAPTFGSDLRSDIIMSLGTDARASETDAIPDGTSNRRGWWGDISPANSLTADEFGSLFWLLSREKQLPSVLVRVREYATRALQWIIDDGIAERIEVDASFPQLGWILLEIRIYRPAAPPVRYRFDLAWTAQANLGAA